MKQLWTCKHTHKHANITLLAQNEERFVLVSSCFVQSILLFKYFKHLHEKMKASLWWKKRRRQKTLRLFPRFVWYANVKKMYECVGKWDEKNSNFDNKKSVETALRSNIMFGLRLMHVIHTHARANSLEIL